MDFDKIFSFILMSITLVLSIYIYRNITKSSEPPSIGPPFIPFSSPKKKMCSSEKVSCDPNDVNSCENQCGDTEQMKCINVNGENLCLPREPDINCNSKNGGRYVWTGYGFTQSKDWQCLCTQPQIYNGPDCSIKNPSFCSNGNLADDINTPLRDICQCDEGTALLFRDNNTPMCVSNDPSLGGGEDGLYGNYHRKPDWRNVYFMRNDAVEWSNDIGKQFGYFDFNKIYKILTNISTTPTSPNGTPIPTTTPPQKVRLDQEIVNNLLNLDPVFRQANAPFDPNYKIVVPYRYFIQTYIP